MQVSGLIEPLVMINAKWESGGGRHRCTRTSNLGLEKTRRHAGENHERREAMDVGHAHTARISGNFGVVPFDGESDRSIAENAEVVAIVRIFRDPLAGKDQVFSKGLLESSMEFIAKARAQRPVR